MNDEIRHEQRIGDEGIVYLVRDESLRDPKGEFYAWLKSEGFRKWDLKGYFGEPFVWVNIGNRLFAPGMPGIKLAEPAGDSPKNIEEFKAIYEANKHGKA